MAWVTGGKKFGQYTYDHWFDNDDDSDEELTLNDDLDEPLPDTLELDEPKVTDK